MVVYAAIFDSDAKARTAVQGLAEKGFPDTDVLVVTPGGGAEAVSAARNRDFLTKASAESVKAKVGSGKTVALVKVPLGKGRTFTALMEAAGSDSIRYFDEKPRKFLTELFPLVTPSKPNITMMTRKSTSGSWFGMSPITSVRSDRKSWFGFELLSVRRGEWNSRFGFSLLTPRRGEWRSWFGFPLLSERKKRG